MKLLLYIAEGAFAVQFILLSLVGWGILPSPSNGRRVGLLLPSMAYGVSSIFSFAFSSWWPLFLGYSIVRLLAVYEVGVDPKPAQRPSPVGMFVNHGLHIWAGIVGSEIFQPSLEGFALTTTFAVIIQGLDTIGFYRTYTRLLADEPEARSQLPVKTAWAFALKVIWYGLITIITAAFARSLV